MNWNTYWGQAGEHDWWERPAPVVLELIESLSPVERPEVLDLGCGLGRHAIAFAQAGLRVTATDSSENAVAHVSEWAKRLGLPIRTRVCDALETGFPEGSFDVVLSYNVLYHGYRERLAAAISHVHRLLQPGGQFFFTCPSREDGKYGLGEEVAPHAFAWEGSLVPGEIHYFASEADLDEMLSGFRVVSLTKDEHHWDREGEQQFHSYWQVLAEKR